MNSIEIFTRNSAAHYILENLSQCFLSNDVASTLRWWLDEWQKSYFLNAPTGKTPMGLGPGFVGVIAQWKRVYH